MPIDAIVGACWGDEGKGKMTDALAAEADFVVRFQGGRNAGHTIVNDSGRFALHMLPSGVFRNDCMNVLGPGVALDLEAVLSELAELRRGGVDRVNLRISERAQVVMPYHVLFDRLEERRLGDRKFGSTQVGIAPFYADKAAKLGIQVCDLYSPERLRARVESALVSRNLLLEHLYHVAPLDPQEIIDGIRPAADRLSQFVCDTTFLLQDAHQSGARILVEGQLGALRDVDHGVYPYTTSSSPLAGHASVGAGLPSKGFDRIVAVAKAYSSCVGATPFVSEVSGEQADDLRERGQEFGATTGRPRRVGWFDGVATRYGCQLQGATEVALTLLDVLDDLEEIPICTAYRMNGRRTTRFPVTGALGRATPVLESMPGWQADIGACRSRRDLPDRAVAYVDRLESELPCPIGWVSVGPHREALFRWH